MQLERQHSGRLMWTVDVDGRDSDCIAEETRVDMRVSPSLFLHISMKNNHHHHHHLYYSNCLTVQLQLQYIEEK